MLQLKATKIIVIGVKSVNISLAHAALDVQLK
jgi:hypothetical protein